MSLDLEVGQDLIQSVRDMYLMLPVLYPYLPRW